MSNVISFEDFKRKKSQTKEYKIKVSKKNAQKIQESLTRINQLIKEAKDLASKNAESILNGEK